MATELILYKENDQWFRVAKIQNSRTLAYITAATLAGNIYALTDTEHASPITGGSSLTLVYDDSDPDPGTYYGQITELFNPAAGRYIMVVSGQDNGIHIKGKVKVKVKEREF